MLSVLKTVFWHVSLGEKFLTFWRIILPSSPWRWRHYHHSKCWELFTQQHIVTIQMTWILNNTIFRMLNLTLLPVQTHNCFLHVCIIWAWTLSVNKVLNSWIFEVVYIAFWIHSITGLWNTVFKNANKEMFLLAWYLRHK